MVTARTEMCDKCFSIYYKGNQCKFCKPNTSKQSLPVGPQGVTVIVDLANDKDKTCTILGEVQENGSIKILDRRFE